MMALYLVKPDLTYFEQYREMLHEWETISNDMNPWFFKTRCETIEQFASHIQMLDHYENANIDKKYATQTSFFVVDENNRLIGGASLRHFLTIDGLYYGGHIGYGVRPSERRKGYATQILRLALVEAKKRNIYKVLLLTHDTNIGSNRVIQHCGGILDNKITDPDNDLFINRYWIDIL